MNKLLQGQVAVVIGVGSGIGRAEAIYLAQQGAKVVVNDIGTPPRMVEGFRMSQPTRLSGR